MASAIPARLVALRSVALAVSFALGGVASASVLGVPLGTVVGNAFGWRVAFAVLAASAVHVAAGLILVLPVLRRPAVAGEGAAPGSRRSLARPSVITGLIVVGLLVMAHFAAYTYIRPALETLSGLTATSIAALLLLYGVFGLIGNFTAGFAAGQLLRPRSGETRRRRVVSTDSVAKRDRNTGRAVGKEVAYGVSGGRQPINQYSPRPSGLFSATDGSAALRALVFDRRPGGYVRHRLTPQTARRLNRDPAHAWLNTRQHRRTGTLGLGLGLVAQTDAILAECDRRCWTVEIVSDLGCSGKHVNPELWHGVRRQDSGLRSANSHRSLEPPCGHERQNHTEQQGHRRTYE